MPSLVVFNMINVNSPQQNAGVFIGESNINGWDANQKSNAGQTGTYGVLIVNNNFNYMFDGNELIDGQINDPDVKADWNAQV